MDRSALCAHPLETRRTKPAQSPVTTHPAHKAGTESGRDPPGVQRVIGAIFGLLEPLHEPRQSGRVDFDRPADKLWPADRTWASARSSAPSSRCSRTRPTSSTLRSVPPHRLHQAPAKHRQAPAKHPPPAKLPPSTRQAPAKHPPSTRQAPAHGRQAPVNGCPPEPHTRPVDSLSNVLD
jgi:hypothetical protein